MNNELSLSSSSTPHLVNASRVMSFEFHAEKERKKIAIIIDDNNDQ